MKKLIPALAMLLVAAVLMGTSTYAWFSMNTTVSATGMSVTATTPVNLLISNASAGTFLNTAAADETYTGKLYPASSLNAVKFNAIQNTGNYIGVGGIGGVAEDGSTKFQKTSNQGGSGVIKLAGAANGYWAEYSFFVKLSEAPAATTYAYLSALKIAVTVVGDGSTTATADTYYTDIDLTNAVTAGTILASGTPYYTAHNLAKAARVGLIDVTNSNTLVAIYAKTGASVPCNVVTADYTTEGAVYNDSSDKAEYSATTSYTNSNHFEVSAVEKELKIVVWIEGQDAACKNANAGATVAVNFEFQVQQ